MATGARRRLALAGRAAGVLVLALFVGLLFYGLSSKAPRKGIDTQLSEARAARPPELELPVLTRAGPGPGQASLRAAFADGSVSTAELRGRPVVLNFWASWCPPCRTETPTLQRGWTNARPTGVVFMGVNMQDISSDARAFVRELNVTYPNLRDRGGDTARAWGVTALPETFFLRPDGRVVAHVIGEISATQLRRGVEAARRGEVAGSLQGGGRRSTR